MMSNPFIKKRTTVNDILNNDPERIEVYRKIEELFITAGYFRARISTLEPFDKILGGLAWTLTGCFYDIDIEFKDDMNIAEKIRVSERVVAGLKSINCPYMLGSVQIQGLDLKPIYQCLQWLVKKLLETRDERNQLNKNFSMNFIENRIDPPTEEKMKLSNETDEVLSAKYNYLQQNRKYKPKAKLNFEYNDELRIFFGMIEFGFNKEISFQKQLIELLKKKKIVEDKGKGNKSGAAAGPLKPGAAKAPQNELTKEEMKALNDIMNNNIEAINEEDIKKQKVNASIIEAIFSENMALIASEIENFDNAKGDEGIDKIKLYAKEKERLEQNKANIVSQINQYDTELTSYQQQDLQEKEEIQQLQMEIEKLKQTQIQNERNKETILQKVKEEKLSEEKLKFLSEKNKRKEELKANINKFKKECLAEKKTFDAQLENYQRKIDQLNDSENIAVFNEIDTNYNAELQKNTEKKKDLFNQNKVINMLTRKIQLFPSKLEIIQYEKRFQELYDQINRVSEKSYKILGENNSKAQVISLLEQKQNVFIELRTLYQSLKPKEKEKFKTTLNNVKSTIDPALQSSTNKLKDLVENIEKYQKQLNDARLHESNYLRLIKEYNKEYNKYSSS